MGIDLSPSASLREYFTEFVAAYVFILVGEGAIAAFSGAFDLTGVTAL